jgi:hypothetical protein
MYESLIKFYLLSSVAMTAISAAVFTPFVLRATRKTLPQGILRSLELQVVSTQAYFLVFIGSMNLMVNLVGPVYGLNIYRISEQLTPVVLGIFLLVVPFSSFAARRVLQLHTAKQIKTVRIGNLTVATTFCIILFVLFVLFARDI